MTKMPSPHYDKKYFTWQRSIGEFGGWANLTKFQNHIKSSDRVLEFGCGGGWLLKNITCQEKMGIEINDTAKETAINTNTLQCVKYSSELTDDYYDIIISNHALEHCENPFAELKTLRTKLKPQGKIVFVVPCERWSNAWNPNDINKHLFTWNPMTLGNLFSAAGYTVESVEPYLHKWPPHYKKIAKFGKRVFNFAARLYGIFKKDVVQIKIIARR